MKYILATLEGQQGSWKDFLMTVTKQALRNHEAKKLNALFWSVATTEGIGDIPHLMRSSQQRLWRSCIILKQGHRQY